MNEFADDILTRGVEIDVAPLEAPRLVGKRERRGDIREGTWRRTVQDSRVVGLEAVEDAATMVARVKNELGKKEGLSPSQLLLGSHALRVPGRLLQDDEAQRREVLEACDGPKSAMARSMAMRDAARVA